MADNARGTQRGVNLSNRAGDAPKDQDTDPRTPPATPEPDPKDDRDEESQIVHRVNTTDDKGQPKVVEHGPMPVSEWADYERKNNL